MPHEKGKFFDTIIKLWGGIGEKQYVPEKKLTRNPLKI